MGSIKVVHSPIEKMMAKSEEARAASGKGGIICPRCGRKQFKKEDEVKDTWDVKVGRRRRRQCRCGEVFWTLELSPVREMPSLATSDAATKIFLPTATK